MLERSTNWPMSGIILAGGYGDPLPATPMLSLLQTQWDRTGPVAPADTITTRGFPETPPKQLFMQIGIADAQVPNVASEVQARTMGIPVITPTPYTPFGVSEAASAGSGLVIYDFGLGNT